MNAKSEKIVASFLEGARRALEKRLFLHPRLGFSQTEVALRLIAIVLFTLAVAANCLAQSIDDTPTSRKEAAERLMKSIKFSDLFPEEYKKLKTLQATQQDPRARNLDIEALAANSFVLSLSKNYSPKEIEFLGQFYTTEVGRSVLRKWPQYSQDGMAFMLRDLIAAFQAQ